MATSQTLLTTLDPEYCEHSKPLGINFVCTLTDFGFVWRCPKEEKTICPDLEYESHSHRRKKHDPKIKTTQQTETKLEEVNS